MCYSNYAERGAYGRHGFKPMHHGHHQRRGRWGAGWMRPPVNVQEHSDRYELFVFAPGLSKADFLINLQGDVLTIATKQRENEQTTEKWTRREYQPGGFERQFVLNEKIDRENISARYEDGVLIIALQKLPGHDVSAQEIVVA
ncbi:MAG: Hsp20/alpha crystallin family protein [Lewinellaceae bacterium]|jgi:HSP20 family protein|nr:Hsp20/alpha crystallin family protein [Lewinellaceae bacterium]